MNIEISEKIEIEGDEVRFQIDDDSVAIFQDDHRAIIIPKILFHNAVALVDAYDRARNAADK